MAVNGNSGGVLPNEHLQKLGWRRLGTMTGQWASPDNRVMAMAIALKETGFYDEPGDDPGDSGGVREEAEEG